MKEEIKKEFIVKPHKLISSDVMEEDISGVATEYFAMLNYCLHPQKQYKIILAVAHPQTIDKNPLRFFVTVEKELIINPVITRHTRHTVDSLEGCLSFPNNTNITVQRYNKCEVEYCLIDEDNNLIKKEESLSGQRAKMFQHEIDHLDGIYIYD